MSGHYQDTYTKGGKSTRTLGTLRARLRSLRRQGADTHRQQRKRLIAERRAANPAGAK